MACTLCRELSNRARSELTHSVRERLKDILRQYELRERHFECLLRSKELELLLAKYREQEQRQLVDIERSRIDKLEEDVGYLYLHLKASLTPLSESACT